MQADIRRLLSHQDILGRNGKNVHVAGGITAADNDLFHIRAFGKPSGGADRLHGGHLAAFGDRTGEIGAGIDFTQHKNLAGSKGFHGYHHFGRFKSISAKRSGNHAFDLIGRLADDIDTPRDGKTNVTGVVHTHFDVHIFLTVDINGEQIPLGNAVGSRGSIP